MYPTLSKPTSSPSIPVDACLTRLRVLSLNLDTYGEAADAASLREIISQLEEAFPSAKDAVGQDFVVAETFRVPRSQVASLLCCALNGSYEHWFRIVEVVKPVRFQFRVHPDLVITTIDCPLNDGGALVIRSLEPDSNLFRLDLASLASGLNDMASRCPRHFADFLNGKADTITGSVFLQCCLFGELIY